MYSGDEPRYDWDHGLKLCLGSGWDCYQEITDFIGSENDHKLSINCPKTIRYIGNIERALTTEAFGWGSMIKFWCWFKEFPGKIPANNPEVKLKQQRGSTIKLHCRSYSSGYLFANGPTIGLIGLIPTIHALSSGSRSPSPWGLGLPKLGYFMLPGQIWQVPISIIRACADLLTIIFRIQSDVVVSINGGTQKWMVSTGKSY